MGDNRDYAIITLEQYTRFIYRREGTGYINKETGHFMDLEDIERRYMWHLKNQ